MKTFGGNANIVVARSYLSAKLSTFIFGGSIVAAIPCKYGYTIGCISTYSYKQGLKEVARKENEHTFIKFEYID